MLFFWLCFYCFFCVFSCVLCASRSPGATEKSTQREDELYIESAPLAEILSKCANFARRIPKHLHRLVNSPRDFPPNSYTILKRIFAFTMRLPQKIMYNLCANFSTWLPPKRLYIFSANSMCDSPRDIVRRTQIDHAFRCSTCLLWSIFLRPSLEPTSSHNIFCPRVSLRVSIAHLRWQNLPFGIARPPF